MRKQSIGIGVIDAGMADRTRPGGYRTAPAVHDTRVPAWRPAAVDAHKALGHGTDRRHGSPDAGTGRGIALRTTFTKPPHALHPTGP